MAGFGGVGKWGVACGLNLSRPQSAFWFDLGYGRFVGGSGRWNLLGFKAIIHAMVRTQQTFTNSRNSPIYVSVEPWPQCFELEPGDKLTLVWEASTTGDAMQVDFINERELVVWPNGAIDDIDYLFNGEPGIDRSWTFKHR
jgi:hypothetical protein